MGASAEQPAGGVLYLVSTPIGNLEDITLRALRIFREVEVICAEDTRTLRRLLSHYNIEYQDKRLLSYYSHNERGRIPQVLQLLKEGHRVALVSEAGTPTISDPGYRLVAAAIGENIPVVPIPGASACLSALIASGLPTQRFVFEGFLPKKKGRTARLKWLCQAPATVILYESPHRLLKTIEDIVNLCGNRYIVISRELTKRFEEFIRGYATDLLKELRSRTVKGECVLLIASEDFRPEAINREKVNES
ncbi:MAG: 16S rRNA (cytidine(1402)-2'-O)-methyltransferase [Calditrichaeota bacterium]|nr:MAG: 16S rRNA (cytidine(1402)-2'-O)-methyltransferase [Calditrichota bacterium]